MEYFGNNDCLRVTTQQEIWKQMRYGKRVIFREIIYGEFAYKRKIIDELYKIIKNQLDIFVKAGELEYEQRKNIITLSFCFHIYVEAFYCPDKEEVYFLISQPPLSPFRKNTEIYLVEKAIRDIMDTTTVYNSLYDVVVDPPKIKEIENEDEVWDSFPEAIKISELP